MADTPDPIEQIRQRLLAGGYDGLYYPGECGCTACDLAPCCNVPEEGDEWIADCKPGHKHMDPRPGNAGEWIMKGDKAPMTLDDWHAADWW
jgi:hypothetical protein